MTDPTKSIWILGLDPGMTTGWALAGLVKEKYEWKKTGEVKFNGFDDFLKKAIPKVDVVCCEDFVIRTNVRRWDATRLTSNNLVTAKLVGRVEFACSYFEKPLFKYEPNTKRMGYTMNSLVYKPGSTDRMRHQFDAMSVVRVHLRKVYDI